MVRVGGKSYGTTGLSSGNSISRELTKAKWRSKNYHSAKRFKHKSNKGIFPLLSSPENFVSETFLIKRT
jgi:hypothetical protein